MDLDPARRGDRDPGPQALALGFQDARRLAGEVLAARQRVADLEVRAVEDLGGGRQALLHLELAQPVAARLEGELRVGLGDQLHGVVEVPLARRAGRRARTGSRDRSAGRPCPPWRGGSAARAPPASRPVRRRAVARSRTRLGGRLSGAPERESVRASRSAQRRRSARASAASSVRCARRAGRARPACARPRAGRAGGPAASPRARGPRRRRDRSACPAGRGRSRRAPAARPRRWRSRSVSPSRRASKPAGTAIARRESLRAGDDRLFRVGEMDELADLEVREQGGEQRLVEELGARAAARAARRCGNSRAPRRRPVVLHGELRQGVPGPGSGGRRARRAGGGTAWRARRSRAGGRPGSTRRSSPSCATPTAAARW